YQPTGYIAPPGQEIQEWAWGNVDNLTLLVGTQRMANRNNPTEQSENKPATPLTPAQNTIRDPIGGPNHNRKQTGPTTH
ncbi:M60 family peptidase N-terminal accessory domain-containing protein, partial [Pseudomonas syringae group genomosp. 7]|uniref:M60 family peptidase N-terminal accessory domain-containing protein n=1 Tax=Pseudomonas syringae group genomosp. 7 TaxID=251699 RepID=UPI00376FF412